MARMAGFVAIQDHGSTIPDPETGINDVHFPPFDAPGVSGAPAILAFRMESNGDVVLSADLNGRLLFQQPFTTTPVRSWHEVISTSGIVQATGNNLTLAVSGQGSVTVSDVVLFFQAWVPAHPTPLIAAQETRYSQPLSCGAQNGVIVISGHHFLQIGAPNTPDLAAFLDKTQEKVRARLDKYFETHGEVSRETTEILMMDVEKPHPKDLHTYTDDDVRYAIVDAYKTRIAAFKTTFPKAKLCMYGTLNPDPQGRPDAEAYLPRLAALKEAGTRGLYDQLDYLVPVLYPRFGPNDGAARWTSYRAYTEQGIDGSRQLLKSNNTSLPVLPITGFRVLGTSAHKGELLLDLPVSDPLRSTLHVQLEMMAEKGIRQVVFWVGKDSDLLDSPNPNGRTVTQHVCGR